MANSNQLTQPISSKAVLLFHVHQSSAEGYGFSYQRQWVDGMTVLPWVPAWPGVLQSPPCKGQPWQFGEHFLCWQECSCCSWPMQQGFPRRLGCEDKLFTTTCANVHMYKWRRADIDLLKVTNVVWGQAVNNWHFCSPAQVLKFLKN